MRSTMLILFTLLSNTSIFSYYFFFFNDTATTEIYTLSLTTLFRSRTNVALSRHQNISPAILQYLNRLSDLLFVLDRKSTRLNSSHGYISYAVFCLKKKK